MTASNHPGDRPRARYLGRGVPTLRGPASGAAVALPSQDDATFRPEPLKTRRELFQRFLAVRGPIHSQFPPSQQTPLLSIADVNAIANFTTFALRNDLLLLIDARDRAVIWETWRRAIVNLNRVIRGAPRADAKDPTTRDTSVLISSMIENSTTMILLEYVDAVKEPGAAFGRFCPWRREWATDERLHPERFP